MEHNNSYGGTSWADQWDYGEPYSAPGKSSNGGKKSGLEKTKAAAATGFGKTKSAAATGFKKVKEGTTSGFHWIKDKYQKRTQKH